MDSPRRITVLVAAALLPALALAQEAPPSAAAPGGESGAASASEEPRFGELQYWLLEEFDWGDDEEVVAESVLFDPYFSCTGTQQNPCILVSTVVDREKLLANFQHHRGELWQVVILTPDLDGGQAREHLPRVWRVLVDYVTRHRGEPLVAVGLPELEGLELSAPELTHFWSFEDLEVRVMVGRRDADRFYVGAFFSDPARGREARPAYLRDLAVSDARKRAQRAAERRKAGDGRPGAQR